MILVQIPVASCPACFRSFTLADWRALELCKEQPQRARLERRICPTCSATMAFDLEGLDECDLTMDADLYELLYPISDRPRLARMEHAAKLAKRRKLRRVAAAIGALAAVVVSTLLAYLLGA